MSQSIAQHLSSVEQWKDNPAVDLPWDQMYTDFLNELKRLQASNQVEFRSDLQKVTNILVQQGFDISESLRTYLLECFIQLSTTWRGNSSSLEDLNQAIIFENLSIILTIGTWNVMSDLLVQELIQCLHAIARGDKNMFLNRNIPVIGRLLVYHTQIASNYKRQFMEKSPVDDAVIACLLAPYTLEVLSQFKSSVTVEERTPAMKFVFDGLFDYLTIINREELGQRAMDLRKHCLPSISDLLDTFAASSDTWTCSAVITFEGLTTLFLYSVQVTVANDLHLDVQIHLCDTGVRVLLETTRSIGVSNNCLQYVYMGTMNDKILDHLKNGQLANTMLKFTHMYRDHAEIQFNSYRILAAIMTEEDIKRLDDPGSIAKVFMDELNQVKDRVGWEVRMRNLLTTLKSELITGVSFSWPVSCPF